MKHCLVCDIFLEKFASQLNLPELYKFLYTELTALDVCSCSQPCEEKKGSRRQREHFFFNFDTMSKCLQNIVALKKNLRPKFMPILLVSLSNFAFYN